MSAGPRGEQAAATAEEAHPRERRTTKKIDGVAITGWFTEDFTLAERRTLRARERLPELRTTNTVFDGLYQVPTFQEVIDLAKRAGVGIYPETKHPTYFDSIRLCLEEPLVATLDANGYRGRNAPVFVQSFETANLKELNRKTKVPLVQLVEPAGRPHDFVVAGDPRSYADLVTPEGLAEIATYADGLGPNKNLIVPRDADGNLQDPTSLVRDAHRAGLAVHPWTFRRENRFLPVDFQQGNRADLALFLAAAGDLPAELRPFFRLGVDGVFTDNPGIAVAVRHELFGTKRARSAHPGPLQDARLGG
jgi:glycerophosphoryl diester phosphodiesterase